MSRAGVAAVALICSFAGAARADGWRVESETNTGSMPWSVTVSPEGATLWVAMVGLKDRDNVWRYDASTLEVQAKSKYRGHAVETILVAGGKRLLVTNSRRDELVELDAEDLSVERRLSAGKIPKDFRVSADETTAYLANWGGHGLTILDLDSGDKDFVRTGRHARGIALAPDGSEAYVTNFGARSVAVVDLESLEVTARIKTCKNPRHVVVVGDQLLVSCFGASHVLVIDRQDREVVRKLKVGKGPKTIALAPDGSFAVTADERGNSVSFIDLSTWQVDTVKLPARKPCGVTISPDGDKVYVTARGSHELLVLSRDSE